jgi:hypothetical protein
MAPWNRLRPDRTSEKDGKKHTSTHSRPQSQAQNRPQSQLSPAEPPPTLPVGDGSAAAPTSPPTQRRNHRTRDSVVSLSAVHDSTKPEATPPRIPLLELPEAEKGTSRPQRFSLLRFRHASDSQLSKTAQEHAFSPPPPVPGESNQYWSRHLGMANST